MGASRTTLRRAIGRLCGDLLVGTATANGTSSTFVDTVHFPAGDNALVGRLAYYVSGTAANLGLTRRVSANVESTATITVGAAWTSASATGDVIELFSSRSISPGPDEIHDKINDCIRAVADQNLTVVDDTDATFDATNPYIAIPAGWVGLCGVQWQDSLAIWHRVERADYVLHKNLGAYGQVELRNVARWSADGLLVHLVGVTPAPELATDAATTVVNADWLTKQAAGELLIQNARLYEDTAGAERRGNLWLQQAQGLLPKAQSRPPANFQRLNRS